MAEDYRRQRLTLRRHPLALLRPRLPEAAPSNRLAHLPANGRVTVAGLVLVRQRPGSANGVIFATLEDETGVANIIVWPKVFEAYRATVMRARLLWVQGRLQREGLVIHVIADHLEDRSHWLGELDGPGEPSSQRFTVKSRDFH